MKGLNLSASKCKTLHINAKEETPELDINGSEVENVKEFKYFGDYLNNKANYDKLFEERIKSGESKVYIIQAFRKEITFGHFEVKIILQLYDSIFLSALLFNCQSLTRLSKSRDLSSLESVQYKYLKQTMHVPYSTPNAGVLLELGVIPIKDVINMRKLSFLRHILTLSTNDPVYKMYLGAKETNL